MPGIGTASNHNTRIILVETGTLLGQVAVTGNDYEQAEVNWAILGVSVTTLGVTGNILRATESD